jgi:predicted metal-binding membrane protein
MGTSAFYPGAGHARLAFVGAPTGRLVPMSASHPASRAVAIVVVAIPLACWIWVVAMARDMYGAMDGASAWMMTFDWDARHLVLLWGMWAAMMAAMMLPSATPFVLLFARAARHRDDGAGAAARVYALAAGYVAVWAAFSVGATALQRGLATASLLSPMMEPARPSLSAALLLVAGAYQFTPWKDACLSVCRSPLSMLMSGWRDGIVGAFRMGAAHGLYCLGCCWALMLLLFAGGVMSLTVIVALTAGVAIEKLAPFGRQSARVSGAMLLAAGVWVWMTRVG